MRDYRINVRVELREDETGRVVTWSDHDYYFQAERADGGHPDFVAIDDAIEGEMSGRIKLANAKPSPSSSDPKGEP